MSTFIDMFTGMLPVHSEIQKTDNQFRKVLDKSVGEYMDNTADIFDELFLTSAGGSWLDCWGKDYGVTRKNGETDEDYRRRIIQEKLEHLTPEYLTDLFGLDLFVYVPDFDANANCLTSDNCNMNGRFMIEADIDTLKLLNHKFILGNELLFLFDNVLHYIWQENFILNTGVEYVLGDYLDVYTASNLNNYFKNKNWFKYVKLLNLQGVGGSSLFESCGGLTTVVLSAPNMTSGYSAFKGCGNLVSVDLDLPNVAGCGIMFRGCGKLENVTANLPNLSDFTSIFLNASKLKYINVNIPTNKVTAFTDYINSLNLRYLTTLIINGEEVDLS